MDGKRTLLLMPFNFILSSAQYGTISEFLVLKFKSLRSVVGKEERAVTCVSYADQFYTYYLAISECLIVKHR